MTKPLKQVTKSTKEVAQSTKKLAQTALKLGHNVIMILPRTVSRVVGKQKKGSSKRTKRTTK